MVPTFNELAVYFISVNNLFVWYSECCVFTLFRLLLIPELSFFLSLCIFILLSLVLFKTYSKTFILAYDQCPSLLRHRNVYDTKMCLPSLTVQGML